MSVRGRASIQPFLFELGPRSARTQTRSSYHYEWDANGEPPLIEAHSIAKHEVTQRYAELYIEILTSQLQIPRFSVTIVDGFAGGGLYRRQGSAELHEGSPLLLMRAMRRAGAAAQARRKNDFKLQTRYFFIEAHKGASEHLKNTLDTRIGVPAPNECVHQIHGTFEESLEGILANTARDQRVLFLLDQYGYTGVPIPSIRRIFEKIDRPEVILTFATDWLIDYLADTPAFHQAIAHAGLDIDLAQIRTQLVSDPIRGHAQVQHLLAETIRRQSNAPYYTPFFIKSPKANRSYWLLHFSAHPRARDAMATLHWKMTNTFMHPGAAGLNMLGYDPKGGSPLCDGLGYLFDDDARHLTHKAVREDAVQQIFDQRDGVQLKQLFANVCNSTPATMQIMGKSLQAAARDGEILVYNENGTLRRPDVIIQDSDLLTPSRQVGFFYPRRL